jgi:hypothetical protein
MVRYLLRFLPERPMLQLRPNCECCDVDLPPDTADARICSFECTFCAKCVDTVLSNVCPNCGGGFSPRPVRPASNWKGDNYLGKYPPTGKAKHRPVDLEEHGAFATLIKSVPPERR